MNYYSDSDPGGSSGTQNGRQTQERQISILIIDDNRDFARMFSSLFDHLGYRAAVAASAEQGIAKIREMVPDLVFCDIGLPAKGGLFLAETVRADKVLKSIYLVALSCFEREKDGQRAVEAGYDLYISKPIHTSVLETVLKTVQRQQKAAPHGKVRVST
jgi:CheY-like chemotaxis protein